MSSDLRVLVRDLCESGQCMYTKGFAILFAKRKFSLLFAKVLRNTCR